MLLMTSCSVSKVQDKHISQYLKFQGILEFVGRQLVASSIHSHPPRGKECAYLVASVFSGSVATKLR